MVEYLLLFLTVPVITGLIGWGTNWAAVKMIFHPTRFVGLGPLGWQGILYKQGEKFATGVADMVKDNLVSAEELAERFDLDEATALIELHLEGELPDICREVVDDVAGAGTWQGLPDHVRDMIVAQVVQQSRSMGGEIFQKIQGLLVELIDVHGLTYKQLSGENVARLARLTKKIGRSEFKFIEYYGGFFGLVIGLAQVAVWTIMQRWWLMPIVGVMVGLVTNWLAIQMIFRPHEPRKFFGGLITYQGLFPKRQPEIAKDYGHTAKTEILTPRSFLTMITEGEKGLRLIEAVSATVTDRIKEEWKKYESMVSFDLTDEHIASAQAIVLRRVMALSPQIMPDLEAFLERQMDIGNMVESKLTEMPKPQFEGILRGIFEEDELTLILVGGVLGGSIGLLQGFVVLSL